MIRLQHTTQLVMIAIVKLAMNADLNECYCKDGWSNVGLNALDEKF